MPEDRNCGCVEPSNSCGYGLFGGDSQILFFLIIFLLLFTNNGCGCGGRNSGCC